VRVEEEDVGLGITCTVQNVGPHFFRSAPSADMR